MKKTITMYELLGLIKDGKAPKKIKYENREYYLYDNKSYLSTDKTRFFDRIYFGEDYLRAELNNEVEILDEEEFEDIEEITLNGEKLGYGILSKWLGSKQTDNEAKLCSSIECLGITLNLLIKNQKKIIERINKDN